MLTVNHKPVPAINSPGMQIYNGRLNLFRKFYNEPG